MAVTSPAGSTTRQRHLTELARPFDVLVVGGGINGLAVAWDAALAGRRVLIVDKGDWGSGTSSWSSRMIHGGLKYLEKYDVPLVRESLRDREWLLRNAPHLVKPLPFLLPFYRGNAHSALALRAGMVAYDVLSFDKSVPRHRVFSRDALHRRLPGLSTEGLQGGARYFDAQVAYAERLCVELMLAARSAGAITLNHARAEQLRVQGDRVIGATIVDTLTDRSYPVDATVTVNVAGAWVDDVLAGTSAAAKQWIGGTKGTHLVLDAFAGAPAEAMYYESEDARPMMVIPWLGRYLIGSTDVHYSGNLDTVSADADELDYILRETNRLFPAAGLTADDIHYAYTGVRPLPFVGTGKTADISRRHEIHDHAPELEGLLSVIGGKLTTFRALAGHTMAKLSVKLGSPAPSTLSSHRLPGAPSGRPTETALTPGPDAVSQSARLHSLYGSRADYVQQLATRDDRHLDDGLLAAEVQVAVRQEEAVHLADVMARRVMVGLRPDLGRSVAEPVANVMAAELGWDDARTATELQAYENYLKRFALPAAEQTSR